MELFNKNLTKKYFAKKLLTEKAYKKLELLKKDLLNLKSVVIAFSGGVDSAFLLKVASDVFYGLGFSKPILYKPFFSGHFFSRSAKHRPATHKPSKQLNAKLITDQLITNDLNFCKNDRKDKVIDKVIGKVIAVTISSPAYPKRELENAINTAKLFNVKHIVIESNELENINFVKNDINRCYYCKKSDFLKIKEIARDNNIDYVIDGQNYDDLEDFRPGMKAAEELGVLSPLKTVKLTKDEIRFLSKQMGIAGWDRPSFACLASRIPYGTEINKNLLNKIDYLEDFLISKGFRLVRVRHHDRIARIEIDKKDFKKILKVRDEIVFEFKKQGYDFVTIDLEGYRTGSLNKFI